MATAMHPQGIPARWWNQVEDPEGFRLEVIGGEFVMSPSPSVAHALIQSRLVNLLTPQVPKDFAVVCDLEWRLEHDGIVASAPRPDLMVIPTDIEHVTQPPLLAIEILSPSDRERAPYSMLTRMEAKKRDFADNGLDHYIEVDPITRSLLRYERQDEGLTLRSMAALGESLGLEQPFPYYLSVREVFGLQR